LEQHLGLAVANLAKDGGDFAGAAKEYLTGATFHDNPPKLVIWEIPERVIEMPLKADEKELSALLSKQ
jgi:alginate O-acetyltransferase complex protein AlgJ